MSWQLDPAHTQIMFTVCHLMVTNVRGSFEKFSAVVDFDAASVNTRDANRDGHLRSADFFDVEKFPTLTFTSKNVIVTDANHGRVTGDLTMHGVTHEVVLEVEYSGIVKTPWGGTSAGFNASTKIKRQDWGLVWNAGLETGGVLVGDEVKIEIEAELTQVVEPAAEAK